MVSISPADVQSMRDRAIAVQQLAQSPAWRMLTDSLHAIVAAAKSAARNADSAHQMGLHLGAALAIEDIIAWPQRELSTIIPALAEVDMRP